MKIPFPFLLGALALLAPLRIQAQKPSSDNPAAVVPPTCATDFQAHAPQQLCHDQATRNFYVTDASGGLTYFWEFYRDTLITATPWRTYAPTTSVKLPVDPATFRPGRYTWRVRAARASGSGYYCYTAWQQDRIQIGESCLAPYDPEEWNRSPLPTGDLAQAYPNPAATSFTIPAGATRVRLLNSMGHEMTVVSSAGRVDVHALPEGLYTLCLFYKGDVIRQRVQIKR